MVDQHGPQGVASLGEPRVVNAGSGHEPAAVSRQRAPDEHDPGPGHLGPPAQIHVLAPEGHASVEAAQAGKEIPAYEQDCRGKGEHIAHTVVLLLVEVLGADPFRGHAEAVDVVAGVLDDLGTVPFHDLGTDYPGVAPQRLGHEGCDRVGCQSHVVVAHQEEVGFDTGGEHGVGRFRETGGPGGVDDGGIR